MSDKQRTPSYPFRMEDEVRERAEELARREERSLNWLLNALVKMAMPIWAAKRKEGGK